MGKKQKKIKKLSVAEYVEMHNSLSDTIINRHNVYAMIREGKLKATRGARGAWIIEIEEVESYTVKEFIDIYNKNFNTPINRTEVRKLIDRGLIKAEKVSGKWKIYSNPRRRINNKR